MSIPPKMANTNLMLTKRQTDSNKCNSFLKDKSNEALVSPPALYVPQHDGYVMLDTNVPLFHEINEAPMILDLARLDEDSDIEVIFRRNQSIA